MHCAYSPLKCDYQSSILVPQYSNNALTCSVIKVLEVLLALEHGQPRSIPRTSHSCRKIVRARGHSLVVDAGTAELASRLVSLWWIARSLSP